MRIPASLAVTLAAVWLAPGCELRDEAVGPEAAARGWPAVTLEAARREGVQPRAAAGAGIEYVEGYEAGARRAAAGGLPMLLVFRAAWCRWSGEATRGPLTDAAIVDRSRRFVCVVVDADRDADTCRAFAVKAFPTVLVLDADGSERFRATGSSAAGGLVAALDAVVPPAAAERRVVDGHEPPRPEAAASRGAQAPGGIVR
jgi:hypothetical protein